MNTKTLIQHFAKGLTDYLPEATGYGCHPEVPIGSGADADKSVDLFLVKGLRGIPPEFPPDFFNKPVGRARTSRRIFSDLATDVWIVEAKQNLNQLWAGLGQALAYRSLVKRYYPKLSVQGCAVIYPADAGKDDAIEYVANDLRREFGVDRRIIRVDRFRDPPLVTHQPHP